MLKKIKLTVFYDSWCPICIKFKKNVTFLDLFCLINFRDIRSTDEIDELGLKKMKSINFKGKFFYGFDSIFEIVMRLPLMYVVLPFFFLLKITKSGSSLYEYISLNRKIITFHCDSKCEING